MKYNPEKHHRKSMRLKGYDYSSNGGYFVTLVSKNRQDFFGKIINGEMNLSEIGQIAYDNWKNISEHFKNVEIDEFVIMPNHLHGIIVINSDNAGTFHETSLQHETPLQNNENNIISGKNEFFSNLSPSKNTLSVIIRLYKQSVTMWCKKNNHEYFQWQRNYHEWIIKNENHLERFRNYIYQNPLKWEIDSENPNKK
ncbi:MAG: transposase [Cyanobacteriota bacterium]